MWPEQAEPSAGLSPMALQGSPGRAEDRARSWVSGPGLQLQGLGSAAGDQHSDLFGCFEMDVKVIQEKGIMDRAKNSSGFSRETCLQLQAHWEELSSFHAF